jgi:branched-chain amino acid aminotransferase
MSGVAPIESGEGSRAGSEPRSAHAGTSWGVRRAIHDDVPLVATAVRGLLLELGGAPPSTSSMGDAARALIDDPHAGALLVAEANCTTADPEDVGASASADGDTGIVGVLGASWQTAIHAAGQYVLIQDLWVHPDWRGRGVGGGLLEALYALAHEREIARAEVGLPPARFAGLPATEAFYRGNGFAPLGTRMRRVLP